MAIHCPQVREVWPSIVLHPEGIALCHPPSREVWPSTVLNPEMCGLPLPFIQGRVALRCSLLGAIYLCPGSVTLHPGKYGPPSLSIQGSVAFHHPPLRKGWPSIAISLERYGPPSRMLLPSVQGGVAFHCL